MLVLVAGVSVCVWGAELTAAHRWKLFYTIRVPNTSEPLLVTRLTLHSLPAPGATYCCWHRGEYFTANNQQDDTAVSEPKVVRGVRRTSHA